jgi:glutamyl-Q tRNA(Asp) synthetase
LAALASWLRARSEGGEWLLRIEDIDRERSSTSVALHQIETLKQLGLESDRPVLWQSARRDRYREVLMVLRACGVVLDCRCSKREFIALAHRCRPCPDKRSQPATSQRFRCTELPSFHDQLIGAVTPGADVDVSAEGDFLIWGNKDWPSYQLAVVVDDYDQGVSEVVRGGDLLHATPRQLLLYRTLRWQPPHFLHLPLLVTSDGRKLSKREQSPSVHQESPDQVLKQALALLGQAIPHTTNVSKLLDIAVAQFRLDTLPRAVQLSV